MARPLRGGGGKGLVIKEKKDFSWTLFFPTFQNFSGHEARGEEGV